MLVVASKRVCNSLKKLEETFLDLANVEEGKYRQTKTKKESAGWLKASDEEIQLFLNTHREAKLVGEGLMRDIARRVQFLRKELGYVPTEILDTIHIAELPQEQEKLLQHHINEMKELVRAKNIKLHPNRSQVKTRWHESKLNKHKLFIAINKSS